jgi:hypothetical protein
MYLVVFIVYIYDYDVIFLWKMGSQAGIGSSTALFSKSWTFVPIPVKEGLLGPFWRLNNAVLLIIGMYGPFSLVE